MRVLLVFKGFLGDLILGSPVIRALKEHAGVTYLSVLTSPVGAALLLRDSLVDEVITFDRTRAKGLSGLRSFASELRAKRFDRAYSFHRSPRTALLLSLARIPDRVAYDNAYLAGLYKRLVQRSPELHEVLRSLELVLPDLDVAAQEAFHRARQGLDAGELGRLRLMPSQEGELSADVVTVLSEDKPHILVSPGSAWETKRWEAKGFAEVCAAAGALGFRPVVVGSKSDAAVCSEVAAKAAELGVQVVDLCGRTSIPELLELIRRARCVVCNDSMAQHVASAFKVPTVAVFCATSPKYGFGPWQNQAVVVERTDLFCKPCTRHGSRRCPMGTRACMTSVSSAEVVSAVENFLGK
jgi:heptosyltransferase-2